MAILLIPGRAGDIPTSAANGPPRGAGKAEQRRDVLRWPRMNAAPSFKASSLSSRKMYLHAEATPAESSIGFQVAFCLGTMVMLRRRDFQSEPNSNLATAPGPSGIRRRFAVFAIPFPSITIRQWLDTSSHQLLLSTTFSSSPPHSQH